MHHLPDNFNCVHSLIVTFGSLHYYLYFSSGSWKSHLLDQFLATCLFITLLHHCLFLYRPCCSFFLFNQHTINITQSTLHLFTKESICVSKYMLYCNNNKWNSGHKFEREQEVLYNRYQSKKMKGKRCSYLIQKIS